MKKLTAVLLSLVMTLALSVPAFAADSSGAVTPTPPGWMPAEHYLVFPGDEAYRPENWTKILEMRADAASGGLLNRENRKDPDGSPAMRYEAGLVCLKYAENAGGAATAEGRSAFYQAGRAFSLASSKRYELNGKQHDRLSYMLQVWCQRCYALYGSFNGNTPRQAAILYECLTALGMTMDDFYNAPYVTAVTPENRALLAQYVEDARQQAARVKLHLDGKSIIGSDDVPPEIKNGRTMVPIRALAERLGADVGWDQAAQQVTLTRAGVTIVMTVNSKTAYVNGKAVEMDVAPYITEGRTLIPARYMAEFFGQKVDWDNDDRRVDVTEDRSAVGDSNLEAWALPMGAMLANINSGDYTLFGTHPRTQRLYLDSNDAIVNPDAEIVLAYLEARETLSRGWDIHNREELICTVCSMTLHGHNDSFFEAVEVGNALTPAQYNKIISNGGVDAYMFPYTRQLSEKWGGRGILCWDLFRMSNLVQWGYIAGYITYPEALALLEPAATLLSENFSSWDEAYENYLDGYNWWARNDVLNKDVWDTLRGRTYRQMSDSNIFDDSLFQTGVIPVPGVTADQLLQSVLAD